MKITKYEHACLVVEDGGKKLAIDPSQFAKSFPIDFYDAVVVTHIHEDHLDETKLKDLIAKNPEIEIYTVDVVANQLKLAGIQAEVVSAGQKASVAGFELEFFGGQHAVVHSSIPITQNVGVLVSGKLYYPGDSFVKPNINVDVLAVPASGPWLKMAEAMDFLAAVKPKQAFPTHNIHNSEEGQQLANSILSNMAETVGTKYSHLETGQSLEI